MRFVVLLLVAFALLPYALFGAVFALLALMGFPA